MTRRVEGEGVYTDTFSRTAQHLLQRRLDCRRNGRVLEEDLTVLEQVSRRLTVGDHDDLARAVVATEHPASEEKCVLDVRAVDVVPRDSRQFLGAYLPSTLGESDYAQEVPRELPRDEGLHGESDLLRGKEVVSQRHGK